MKCTINPSKIKNEPKTFTFKEMVVRPGLYQHPNPDHYMFVWPTYGGLTAVLYINKNSGEVSAAPNLSHVDRYFLRDKFSEVLCDVSFTLDLKPE